jgi:hypothetical protein
MFIITRVRFKNGKQHEHITHVEMYSTVDKKTDSCSVADVVAYLRKHETGIYVKDGDKNIPIVIVEADPPYIRTKADGKLTNNLLSLPTF